MLVRANVSLYEPRGDYQLIIDSMHPAGEGLLQQQFEVLKMKLAAEGLFSQNLKKNLPHFSKAVWDYYVFYRCGIARYFAYFGAP